MTTLMKRATALALAFWLLTAGFALAEGLPKDDPVRYPALEMNESLSDANDLEMDEGAIGENETTTPEPGATLSMKPNMGGGSGANVMAISTVSNIQFNSSFAEGIVDFTNPSGSTVNVLYILRVSAAELLRETGRTGYSEKDYAALSAEAGFDPKTSYVVLGQTKGIPPGKRMHSITLGALPDGSALPCGKYAATVVMAAYDISTDQRSMVGIEAAVTVEVLSDSVELIAEGGKGKIKLFTPVSETSAVRYTLVITQGELLNETGNAHNGGGEYVENGGVLLSELGSAQPGNFLDAEYTIGALPDGTALPAGEYTAWIARSTFDESLALWTVASTDTTVRLTVKAAE